jgi:hypothetical protein
VELNINDFANILQLLRRANFVGLDEAAMGVQLAQKVSAKIEELQ